MSKNESPVFRVRIPKQMAATIVAYCKTHDLPRGEAMRVAFLRLLSKRPTKREREAAKVERRVS